MSRRAGKDLIEVYADDGSGDVVHIYPEATLNMQKRINKRFISMKRLAGDDGPTVSLDPTEYNFALLCEFIDHWEGPGFEAPFSEQELGELRAGDPLMLKVLEVIQRENPVYRDDGTEKDRPNAGKPRSKHAGARGSRAAKSK
jgi:hypothetical protein